MGAHASLSAGPSAAAPQPRRRLALRLEVQGAEAQGAEAQGAEAQGAEAQGAEGEARWSPSDGPSHDSLDMDAAFAEYDAPLSEEELLADPDLADIARSYATLERRLGEAIAPTMASDEFDPAARDALLSSVDPSAVRDLGLDALVPSSLTSWSPSAPPGEPRLELPSSPFDSMDEVRFDFGEEDPLVWTEGSPTPLFGDEPSPSPILRNRSARDPLNTPRSVETPVAPEPEGGWHDSSPANEAQRSGVFQRLFGNR